MDSGPSSADRDARLLGLALLHGYVEAEQLQRAAEADSSPSRILAELRRNGALDDPCLEGLAQALRSFPSGSEPGQGTGPTHLEPPRNLSDTAGGRPVPFEPFEDDSGRWNSGARLLRQFTVERWKHYRNLRFIGEGGMGRIYKAQDPDLKRTVALKFLRGQEPNQLKRFLFEAQAQALMDHPNICRVYEISEWQGQHYIAMQYVNGPTLLRAAPGLALDAKLRIAGTVAEAVHAAHRRGLIHRDLKPANVLLEADGQGGYKPYVLDFGLARELDAPGLTASGLVLGTTAYISPEQARGEAHHVDRRTDIYGLGATLYELFAGAPPFGEAQGLDCLRKVVEEEPPPLRSHLPHLPRDLETVVMKCLEKDPARRYDDAQALAEDLRRVREGEPIQAVPTRLGYRVAQFARRNRQVVTISILAMAGFLVLGGIAGYARYTAAVRERYAQHFGQEAERIESLVRFAKLMPCQNIEPSLEEIRQRFLQLEAEVRGKGRLATGPGAYALGRALLSFGEVDQALEQLRIAEGKGGPSPELAYALGRCYGLVYQREFERASRMQSPEERSARVVEIEANWRVPALNYLLRAKGSSLEPHEYLEALIDAYGSNTDSALAKVRVAGARSPWLYEAKRLEGELLLSMAKRLENRDKARLLLEQAASAFASALQVAPSDRDLWTLRAQVHRHYLNLYGFDQDSEAALQACRNAVKTSLAIIPSDPGPLAHLAQALLNISQRRDYKGINPEPSIQEGLDLAGQVLEKQPRNFEALHVRILLHLALGVWHRSTGADAELDFAEAVRSSRSALDLFPGDSTLLAEASASATSLMIFEASRGSDISFAYKLAHEWSGELLKRFPDLPASHQRVAALNIERAEFERLHGGEPGAFVSEALERLNSAAKYSSNVQYHSVSVANAHLILAQHAFATGSDPLPELEKAIDLYRNRLNQSYPISSNFGSFAEALLLKAEVMAARGSDPLVAILEADTAISKGLQLDGYHWLHQLSGQSHRLKALWDRSRGLPAEGHFAQSILEYQEAGRKGNQCAAFEGMARVWLDRIMARDRSLGDLQRGMRSAEQALKLNPKSAEAHLLLGQLHLLRVRESGPAGPIEDQEKGKNLLEKSLKLNGNLKRRVESALSTTTPVGPRSRERPPSQPRT